MRLHLVPFVPAIALVTSCVVATTNAPPEPPKSVPPGQLRSEEVHARNEERKSGKLALGQARSDQVHERNEEKKETKDKLKAEN